MSHVEKMMRVSNTAYAECMKIVEKDASLTAEQALELMKETLLYHFRDSLYLWDGAARAYEAILNRDD